MLTKKFVEEAAVTAASFEKEGLVVVPRPGTLIDGIARACDNQLATGIIAGSDTNVDNTLENTVEQVLNAANAVTSLNAGGIEDVHSEAMLVKTEEEVRKLRVTARITREHVMPLIQELYTSIKTVLDTNSHGRAAQYNIVSSGMPQLYTDPTFVAMIEPYNGLKVTEDAIPTAHAGRLPEEALVQMLNTGSGTMNEYVQAAVMRKEGFLTYLWESLFVDVSELGDSGIVRDHRTIRRVLYNEGNDDAALVGMFFLADSIVKGNYPEGFVFITNGSVTDKYAIECAQYLRDIAGSELRTRARAAMQAVQEGRLVLKYLDTEVVVIKDVYDQFLTKGGTNEMLYGNLFLRTRLFNETEILANGKELETTWERNLATILESDHNNMESHRYEVAFATFEKKIKEAQENEGVDSSLNMTDIMRSFKREYLRLERSDLDEFMIGLAKLVCRVRFPGTDFEAIILDMFAIKRKNPELSTDNVATLAFVNYIADHISNELALVRKS